MQVVIPDEVMASAGLTAEDLVVEISLVLLIQGRLGLRDAAQLGRKSEHEILQILTDRRIATRHNQAEVEAAIQAMRKLGR